MFRRWFGGNIERSYQEGIELFNKGSYSEALAVFERALGQANDSTHPYAALARFYRLEALGRLGSQLLSAGQDAEALPYFETALAEEGGYPDLHFRRGVALLRLDRVTEAEQAAEAALGLNESFHEARVLRAMCLDSRGEAANAESELSVVRAAGRSRPHALAAFLEERSSVPTREELWEHLFDEQARQQRVQRAEQAFHQGDWSTSRDLFTQLVTENPQFPDLRLKLATCHYELGEDDAALEHLDQALGRNSSFADAHVLSATLRLRRGEIMIAREHYDAIDRETPRSPFTDYGSAVCHLLLGDLEAALADLEPVVDAPDPPALATHLAVCLHGLQGRLSAAREISSHDRNTDPRVLTDLIALALYGGDGRWALELVERLGSKDSLDASLARASVCAADGRLDEAMDILDSASGNAAEHPGLILLAATLRGKQGNASSALRRLNGLLAIDPSMPQVRRVAARLLRGHGDHAEALQKLQEERRLESSTLDVELELLFCLRAAGRGAEAAEHLAQLNRYFGLEPAVRLQDPLRWMPPLSPPTSEPVASASSFHSTPV